MPLSAVKSARVCLPLSQQMKQLWLFRFGTQKGPWSLEIPGCSSTRVQVLPKFWRNTFTTQQLRAHANAPSCDGRTVWKHRIAANDLKFRALNAVEPPSQKPQPSVVLKTKPKWGNVCLNTIFTKLPAIVWHSHRHVWMWFKTKVKVSFQNCDWCTFIPLNLIPPRKDTHGKLFPERTCINIMLARCR